MPDGRKTTYQRDLPPASSRRRVLLFDFDARRYAIPVSRVGGLADCGPLRKIPRAPSAVIGLVEWRGNVLTVLDLRRLLGHPPDGPPSCLVRLAPPLQRAALTVGTAVRIAEVTGTCREIDRDEGAADGIEGRFEHEGRTVRLIDPSRLLPCFEGRSRERP